MERCDQGNQETAFKDVPTISTNICHEKRHYTQLYRHHLTILFFVFHVYVHELVYTRAERTGTYVRGQETMC